MLLQRIYMSFIAVVIREVYRELNCSFTDLFAFPVVKADPRRGLDPLVLELVSLGVLLTLSDPSHTSVLDRTHQ